MSMDKTSISNKIYLKRPNDENEANEDDIRQLERSAIAGFNMGKEVYIIEKFPKKIFYFATKIRIEKVVDRVKSLSALSNSRLFKVVPSHSVY